MEGAFEGRKRRPPPPGRGKKKLPWGLRLSPPWTRTLVARHLFATFSIVAKKMKVGKKQKYVAKSKSDTERIGLRSFRLMKEEYSVEEKDLNEVRDAIKILRGRGSRGRGQSTERGRV